MTATLQDEAPSCATLDEFARVLGGGTANWRKEGDGWRRVSTGGEGGGAPRELLEAAAGAPGAPAIGQDADGAAWIALAQSGAGESPLVAAAPIEVCPTAYAERLAHQAIKNASVESERRDQEELLEHYAEKLIDSFEELTFLRRLSRHIEYCDASRSLREVADGVLPTLCNLMAIEGVALIDAVQGPEGPRAGEVIASSGRTPEVTPEWREGLATLIEKNERVVVQNAAGSLRAGVTLPGVQSLVLTQLNKEGYVYGWLLGVDKRDTSSKSSLSNSLGSDEIGSIEASLLETASGLFATHAANVKLFREKEEITIDAIHTLVGLLEARDEYTCGHSDRVALVARRLAQAIGLSDEQCHGVYLAGLLHDIGKVGVTDDVLLKPGQLTDEEFAMIKRHPECGYELLKRLASLGDLLPGVLHHHEAYDGGGYPHGLAGEAIPLVARVLAVADAWDAMTSDRPYRPGMDWEKARSILRNGAGKQWDPIVVEAFFGITDDVKRITDSWQDHLQEILSPSSDKSAAPLTLQPSHAAANPAADVSPAADGAGI